MADVQVRPFVVKIGWPGKEPYLICDGRTFFVTGDRPKDADLRAVALPHVRKWVKDHYPDGIAFPDIHSVLWGSVFFVPEDDAP